VADKYKYKAFISYSHADEKWASWLHKALETYRVPKHLVGQPTDFGPVPERLAPVFRDREELASATNLGDTLTEALRGSACQIVICSPRAAKSHWTNEEIVTFKRLGRAHRIFALIVDGEPGASGNPDTADEECFPPALIYELGPDKKLSDVRTEPIAADARPGKDPRQAAKLKLIAGMLGVGYDDLAQRDAHRRHRRMMALSAAASVGMLVTSGLAVTAYLARNQAQIEAEKANQTTRFLVDMFRMSDPSEARGNTITVREVLDKGADRIEDELAEQPEIQATLMDTMGTVYQSLALLPESASLLEKSLAKRVALFGPDSEHVAQAQAHLAEVLGLQARYSESEPMFRAALETQRKELGDESAAVAASLQGLADVLTMEGRFDEAEPLLRESLDIYRSMGDGESRDVAEALEYLGMNLYDQGQYDDAERLLRDSVALQRRLTPDSLHPDLADAISNLALVLSGGSDTAEVEALYREALAINRAVLDPTHTTIAANLNNLAFLLHDKGELAAAEALYRDVISIRRQRLGAEHPEVALAMNNLAFLLYDKGDVGGAMDMASQSLAMLNRLFPDGQHPHIATSLTNLARWSIDQGSYAEAEPLLARSLDIQEAQLGRDHPRYAVSQTEMARVYLLTGQPELAAEAAAEARETLARTLSPAHWRTAWAGAVEGAARLEQGDTEQAEVLLLDSYNVIQDDPTVGNQVTESTSSFLARLYLESGRPEMAAQVVAGTEAE